MAVRMPGPLLWRVVVSVEGLVLIALGIGGMSWTARGPRGPAPLLTGQFNTAHSFLLLAVGVIAMIAAQWHRGVLWFSALQTVGFVVLFLWGTAQSIADKASTLLSLDAAENFLHAALAIIGFIVLCGASVVPKRARRDQVTVRE